MHTYKQATLLQCSHTPDELSEKINMSFAAILCSAYQHDKLQKDFM